VLTSIWAEILHIDRVGINDNFFAIGGHSLLATRLISQVRDRLKCEVPLQTLFEAPTVALFAISLLQDVPSPHEVEKIAHLIASVAQLSDAEVSQRLRDLADASNASDKSWR